MTQEFMEQAMQAVQTIATVTQDEVLFLSMIGMALDYFVAANGGDPMQMLERLTPVVAQINAEYGVMEV